MGSFGRRQLLHGAVAAAALPAAPRVIQAQVQDGARRPAARALRQEPRRVDLVTELRGVIPITAMAGAAEMYDRSASYIRYEGQVGVGIALRKEASTTSRERTCAPSSSAPASFNRRSPWQP